MPRSNSADTTNDTVIASTAFALPRSCTSGPLNGLPDSRATCCVEPSMNSSPASSYAFASSSSSRSASRAVISPIRYVSIFTPASSIAESTAVSGSSISS